MLPVLAADPRLDISHNMRVVLGIAAFSAAAGFLTPMLVDRWSGGDPDRAAQAYAANIFGCILGPLLAGFLLLPWIGERWALLSFAVPWIFVGGSTLLPEKQDAGRRWRPLPALICGVITAAGIFAGTVGSETDYPDRVVLRDNTATIIATGEGMDKRLLVNGVGITALTPITKAMAHFPLAFLDHRPQKMLVICFGMGTTFRSLLSWGQPTTAVDLVPSVPKVFWYYHPDAPELLASPLAHVVIDDGRRYLERTSDQYDVITIDPPPPVAAAGSSLLYSQEFYALARKHLAPHGILQQWLPPVDDRVARASVAKAIQASFPYVRVFHSFDGDGYHLLASDWRLPHLTAEQLAQSLPGGGQGFRRVGP